jgi:hypothetical protein
MFDLHFLHSSSDFFTTAKLKKEKEYLRQHIKSKNGIDFYETYLRIMLYISILLRTFNCDRKVITNFDLKNGIYYFLQRLFKLKCPIKLRIKQTFSSKLTPSCLTYYWDENYRFHCSSLTIAMQSRQSQDSDSNTLRARWAFPVVQFGKFIVFCKLKFLLDDLK